MGKIANRKLLAFSERGQFSQAIPQFHMERILHQRTPIVRFEAGEYQSIYLHRGGLLLENGLDRPKNHYGRYGFPRVYSISISTVGVDGARVCLWRFSFLALWAVVVDLSQFPANCSSTNAAGSTRTKFCVFTGRSDRECTLVIRIAVKTLASDSATTIARFQPSKMQKSTALEAQQRYFFISRDTCSDSIAKLSRVCFLWGIAQWSRDTLQNGVSHGCVCVKLSTKGGYRTILGEC